MASAAQIKANRENAKSSTGPKTESGKSKSARNHEKFGLFATGNCIQPGEEEAYAQFCDTLWTELAPLGGIEEVTAAEYVRCAWRLRRCALTEASLGAWGNRLQAETDARRGVERPMADPILFEQCLPVQNSIDRARAQAQNGMRRAKADLDKIQAARRSSQIEPKTETPAPQKDEPQIEPDSDRIAPAARPATVHAAPQFNPIHENSAPELPKERKLAA